MSRRVRRIVCYAVNGSGLGHTTRLLSVARWLRRYVTLLQGRAPEVLFLTSSEATSVLLRAGFAAFKLPSKTVVRAAGMDMMEHRRLAKHFVWQVLGTFNPDLLVVDTFPSGSFDELFQLLDGPFAKGFILREVKPEYARRPVFQAALGLYDAVVVPHARDRCEAPIVPRGVRARWSGEVVQLERGEALPRAEVRRALGVARDARLIYLSGGGGGDPGAGDSLAALVGALRREPDLHLLVGAGPLYRGPRHGGPNITWWTDPEVARWLGGCDVAVSAAGYNTFHELLHLGVPAAFYAQDKVADDQRLRAARAAEAGACALLDDPGDADAVRATVARLLDPEVASATRAAARAWVPHNGARRCAELLLAACYDEARVARAAALVSPGLALRLGRLPDGGASVLSRWLPLLSPESELGEVALAGPLTALLDRVPGDAARAVREAIAQGPDGQALTELQAALVSFIDRCVAAGVDLERAFGTVEVGLNKHPLSQETHTSRLAWTRDVLALVTALMAPAARGHLSAAEALGLYRVAPRLVDAAAATWRQAYLAWLNARLAAGDDAAALQARLGALKSAHRRVTLALLAADAASEPA